MKSIPLSWVNAGSVAELRRTLLLWYQENKRQLPWRETRDPYRIWISEIMLQQTRVAVVVERYVQFLQRFPSVQKLATARESTVLAEWSGLGYYHRARNLHATARILSRQYAGHFPHRSEDLRNLPGIGRYTAAAIASIAFNEPVAVVDGNVARVLSRLLRMDIRVGPLWNAAQRLFDHNNPGDFNQAMMELGATICLPAQPRCADCPLSRYCRTRGRGERSRRKPRQTKREIAYGVARRGDRVLLFRRSANDHLMSGMWELPEVTLPVPVDVILFSLRHSITVTDYTVHVIGLPSAPPGGKWIRISRLGALPLTGLAKKILKRAGIIQ